MNKESLLQLIAEAGYNVGIGAKKHFASYDMIEKLPGLIGLLSILIGVLALIKPDLSTQDISAFVLILGVIGLYISQHSSGKERFSKTGSELTVIFDNLKVLYHKVKNKTVDDVEDELQELEVLQAEFNSQAIHNQLVLSDWYAHYKFFWQHQIEWVDEQKKFKFWRDKIPLSFSFSCLSALIIWGIAEFSFIELCVRSVSIL